jgi:hypothetical protein
MKFRFELFLIACLALLISPSILAQSPGEVFDDPDGKYSLKLPPGWLGIVNEDGLGRKDVNIVFKIRENGSLKVRRVETPPAGMSIIDFAKKDEQDTLRFLPSYDMLSVEQFIVGAGRTGALVSYDYKTGGQPFTGREYYLRFDDKTIYILRFRGRHNILGTLRSHTDSIARSFRLKEEEKQTER